MKNFIKAARSRIAMVSVLTLALSVAVLTGCQRNGSAPRNAGGAVVDDPTRAQGLVDPWAADRLLEAQDLARILAGGKDQGPAIFYIGPAVLYKRAHIPGAKAVGQAREPQGLMNLEREAQPLARDSELVLYCGCCPWNVCPNVRPAFKKLQEMGFKRVKLLYLANSFKEDWTNRGLPVLQAE